MGTKGRRFTSIVNISCENNLKKIQFSFGLSCLMAESRLNFVCMTNCIHLRQINGLTLINNNNYPIDTMFNVRSKVNFKNMFCNTGVKI